MKSSRIGGCKQVLLKWLPVLILLNYTTWYSFSTIFMCYFSPSMRFPTNFGPTKEKGPISSTPWLLHNSQLLWEWHIINTKMLVRFCYMNWQFPIFLEEGPTLERVASKAKKADKVLLWLLDIIPTWILYGSKDADLYDITFIDKLKILNSRDMIANTSLLFSLHYEVFFMHSNFGS